MHGFINMNVISDHIFARHSIQGTECLSLVNNESDLMCSYKIPTPFSHLALLSIQKPIFPTEVEKIAFLNGPGGTFANQ